MPEAAKKYGKTRAAKERTRDSPTKRGYNYRWQQASKSFLLANPLCIACKEKNLITPSDCVDHIRPHRGLFEVFWDKKNWQPLCFSCHSKKTARGE